MERDRQMDLIRTEKTIHKVVNELCRPESYELVYQKPAQDKVMPSLDALTEFVEHLRTVLFPAYFSDSEMSLESMPYILGNHLEKAERLLSEQIKRGYGFSCEITYWQACMECEEKSRNLSREFIAAIPGIRKLLATDVMAAYEGDPAARSIGETIFSYPSIKAMTNYRIAHELHRLGVEIIPRIITEMAHSQTGIDIHPGAVIGERFFIDHGSGTVIGETCEIGNNVRLYQGVTLGAVSFPKDESGRLVKGIPRHPIVEDDVIIYSGTTILGRVRIGKGSVIGGNVWLTSDVPPYTRVTQDKHAQSVVMISGERAGVMARGAGGRIVFSVGAAVISLAAVFTMAWADPGRAEAWEKGRIFLWSVAGEKGTLHLLGSIHALKDDAYPLDDRIEQAYAKSVRVVFEADQEETAGTEMQKELVERGTYTGDTTLKDHISKDTCRLLEEKAHAAGLDIAKLQRLRPWLCAVSLSAMEMARMGFSPENGIDAHYAARAKKDGKERVFLESARLQVDLLAGMPEDLQEEFLRQALRELEVIREKSAVLAAAWKSGDVRALEEIVSISLNEHPKVRKDLFTERNEQWVSHLEELMKARGDTLVIVGAGHLVGDDGILSLLRRKGFGPVQQ